MIIARLGGPDWPVS